MAMTVASFTGAEAEELRRAVGMRRSMQRMKDLEGRLRDGMTRNGIGPEAQDNIVQGISSFAMYGFPESHAASFALIAYASAYLKVYYLAAFTCGLLNNQPMGFYSPAVLIKDAQRHGLRVRPIDIQRSDWLCTLERTTENVHTLKIDMGNDDVLKGHDFSRAATAAKSTGALAPEACSNCAVDNHHANSTVAYMKGTGFSPYINPAIESGALAPEGHSHNPTLRIGLNYVKGLRQSSAEAILAARTQHGPFKNVDDLAARVPQLNRKELVALARVGALNSLGAVEHRRDALWQVEQAGRPVGPLLRSAAPAASAANPLKQMTADERISADYAGTGVTTGPHPMAWQRATLQKQGFLSTSDLEECRTERRIRIAGRVICRQRPGTAKGFVFLSLEDETGIANIIVAPDVFERNRLIVTRSRFLSIAGKMQNQEGVIHVKAQQLEPFELTMDDGNRDLGRMWH
jgi:error-prone DNA polymerase